MPDSTATTVVNVDGLAVLVREVDVATGRRLMMETTESVYDAMLMEDLRFSDLQLLTDLTPAQIDALRPSQLAEVVGVCKRMNPHFFAMAARLAALSRPQPPTKR